MATKIVTKNSSTASAVPTASDLVQGELAVNVADKRLFTEDNAGAIVELGTNPSGNVTFQDNGKAIFGAGSDLQIYHDGTSNDSIIDEAGTGNLNLQGTNVVIKTSGGSATQAEFFAGDANRFYYNNALKLATTSTGIDVTGTATVDSLLSSGNVGIGSASDGAILQLDKASSSYFDIQSDSTLRTRIYNDSSQTILETTTNNLIFKSASSEAMRIDASGNVGIGETNPKAPGGAAARSLTLKGTSYPQLITVATAATANSTTWRSISRSTHVYQIQTVNDAVTDEQTAYEISRGAGLLSISYQRWFAGTTEAMRIDSSGNLMVGKTSSDDGVVGLRVSSLGVITSTIASPSANTYRMYSAGYKFYVNTNGGISNLSANNINLSDEREKKNIENLESQWDSLKQWSLKKFHYNADDDSDNKKLGVIAQEVETHNPEVIDEFNVDDDTTRMAVKEQQMMWMAIKALQEAQTRIETLEARVTELENN